MAAGGAMWLCITQKECERGNLKRLKLEFWTFSAFPPPQKCKWQAPDGGCLSNSELILEYDESNSGCHWGNSIEATGIGPAWMAREMVNVGCGSLHSGQLRIGSLHRWPEAVRQLSVETCSGNFRDIVITITWTWPLTSHCPGHRRGRAGSNNYYKLLSTIVYCCS